MSSNCRPFSVLNKSLVVNSMASFVLEMWEMMLKDRRSLDLCSSMEWNDLV